MAFEATREPKQSEETKQWTLRAEEELRLEIEADQSIFITLLNGTAEILGHELSSSADLNLIGAASTVIFTFHGCLLSIKGQVSNAYVQSETPMITYLNTHAALQVMREQRKKNYVNRIEKEKEKKKGEEEQKKKHHEDTSSSSSSVAVDRSERGPITMIVGPQDVGKSSITRLLCNYAVRSRYEPLLVDCDLSTSILAVPGTLAATSIQSTITPQSCDAMSIKAPLVYFYGHLQLTQIDLYKQLIERLAAMIHKRLAIHQASREAGVFINTIAWSETQNTQMTQNLDLIVFMCQTFQVDVLIVVGHDRLYNELKADVRLNASSSSASGNNQLTVTKLAKSGGVITRNAAVRSAMRNQVIREYFYGSARDLRPHTKICAFKDISIFRIGSGPLAPASTLPIGQSRLLDPNAVTKIQPTLELLHSIMAVSYALEMNQVLTTNVAGFVFVTNVDVNKRTVTILCPAPGQLPSTCFIVGSIKWID